MTMASSTTNPVEIVSAIKVRLFRLNPNRYMTPNVPTNDNGTAAAGITVADKRPKKQKHHHNDERDGQHQLELHVSDRCADSGRAVGQHRHWTDEGKRILQLRQQSFDPIDDFNDVGPGLALNIDDHRRRLIHPGCLLGIFHIVDHFGHIRQMDRPAIAIGDDERFDIPCRQITGPWR